MRDFVRCGGGGFRRDGGQGLRCGARFRPDVDGSTLPAFGGDFCGLTFAVGEIDDDFGGLVGIADGGDSAIHFLGRDVAAEGEGFGGSEGLAERGGGGRGFVFLDEIFDEPVFEDGGGDGADLARGGAGGNGGESLTVGCGEEGREASVAGEGVDLLAAVEVGGHFVLRVADGFLELRGAGGYVIVGVRFSLRGAL